MLGRDHDGSGRHRTAIFISQRDLAFAIGPKTSHATRTPRLGHISENAVRICNRRRHEFRRFTAGITEHNALITRAVLVDTLGDMRGLSVNTHLNLSIAPVKAVLLIADIAHGGARDLFNFLIGDKTRGAHLTGQHNQIGSGQCFNRHPRLRLAGEKGIQNSVRYAVTNFVGVTFRNRFTGEYIIFDGHGTLFIRLRSDI